MVFGRAVFIGTEKKCEWGLYRGKLGVFGFVTGGTSRAERGFIYLFFPFPEVGGGVLRKKIRIKEFNPRLVYFHYLQD